MFNQRFGRGFFLPAGKVLMLKWQWWITFMRCDLRWYICTHPYLIFSSFFSTNFVLAGCSEAGWFWVTLINRKWHLGKLAEAVLRLEIRNWNKKSNIKMILDTKSCSVCHTRTVCRKEITNHCISYKEYLKIWHVDISPCHFYNSVHARLSMLTLAYTVCFIATEFASANSVAIKSFGKWFNST